MKNTLKNILFGITIFAGISLFVGCDMMTDDEIEQLINEKLNETSAALPGTTWVYKEEPYLSDRYDCVVYKKYFLQFTDTTMTSGWRTYIKENDIFLSEEVNYELHPRGYYEYYVQGDIIIPIGENEDIVLLLVYDKQKNCIHFNGTAYYRVEE